MKVSKQTQGQLDRLMKTGAYSTNDPILDEVVELYKEVSGEDLDKKCGTCVKNAMYVILKEQKAQAKKPTAALRDLIKKAYAKPAPKAEAPKKEKVVAPVIAKDFDGKKQFTDEELDLCKLGPLQDIATAMKLEGWNTKTTKAALRDLIKKAYAKPAPKAEAPKKEEPKAEEPAKTEDAPKEEVKAEDDGMVEITVTQEILDANPELVADGTKVGEVIKVPAEEIQDEE